MRASVLLLYALLGACAPRPGGMPVAEGHAARTGTVRVVGSAPMNIQVVLAGEGGESVYLAGPLTAELRNASGATVEVTGRLEGGTLTATDYRVRSVDGEPVEMGVVERVPGGGLQLRKADGSTVPLVGATEPLRAGQKVWVQGPSATAVRVQSYGVLRP